MRILLFPNTLTRIMERNFGLKCSFRTLHKFYNFYNFSIQMKNERWSMDLTLFVKGQVWNWVRNCAWESRGIKRSPVPLNTFENKRKMPINASGETIIVFKCLLNLRSSALKIGFKYRKEKFCYFLVVYKGSGK